MRRKSFIAISVLSIGGILFLNFQPPMEAKIKEQQENISKLRREWQQLAAKAKREATSDCCIVDPCSYCLLNKADGVCTCASDLNSGKEICPECLGKWLNGKGAMYAWGPFQRVYPDLADWISDHGGSPGSCPMMGGRMGMMMRGPIGRQRLNDIPWLRELRTDLLIKARQLKLLANYNCCMTGGGTCTYCIEDPSNTAKTICDCKDRLKAGKEICPECLGAWVNGQWNPDLERAFQRAYPSLGFTKKNINRGE